MRRVLEITTLLLVTLPNIHRFLNFVFTDRLSNKPFLNLVINNPSHLKYVAKLSCNLSLMAFCCADINVSM